MGAGRAELPRQQISDWERISAILKKHWKLAAGFAITIFLVAAIATFLMKPVYEPITRLEIDPPGTEVFSLQAGANDSGNSEYLQTEAQKIQSDVLALEVIRDLRLDRNPDLVSQNLADALPENSARRVSRLENAALKSFRQRVTVTRDTSSRLISASFSSHDPQLAALVTNKMVDLFIEDSYRNRHQAIVESTDWLARQLDDIRARMEENNRVLADFQRVNGIADTGENRNTVAEEIADLNRQLTQAEAERIQLQAFLAREKEASPDSLPQVRANPVIQQMTQKLADVRAEIAQSEVIYGRNHPTIKKLHNQAQELEAQIAVQRSGIVSELKTAYAAAKAREQIMEGQIHKTTKQLNQIAQYNQIKKNAQASSDLYNSLYAKVKEAGITAASKSSNMRVVDRARVLDSPTRPHRALNLAVGLLAGMFGGLIMAFVREGLERRIHSVADARRWSGISDVLVVPAISKRNHKLLPGRSLPNIPARHMLEYPYSLEAEAFRRVHASVLATAHGCMPQVVLVVSSCPGEGTTTIAVALALSLAQHSKVCLIDTHLRKPGVQCALGLCAGRGISDVLSGSAAWEEVTVADSNVSNLTVLPAGSFGPDPATALGSLAMRQLLVDLRQQHDFIVIDSAPALPYADVRIMSPLADGIMLVARSGVTAREALARTTDLLHHVQGAPILAVVLNEVSNPREDYRAVY
jgi:capsular exopolysaccharide synthesis family protein